MSYVTLTTDAKNFHRETFTSGTAAPTKILTTTKPASATGSVVFGASLNYIKLKLYSSTSTAPTFYIFGWNYVQEINAYVPQLLCSFTTTMTGSQANAIGPVFEVAGATLVTGDAKIFSGVTTTTAGGFLLIDTLGCEYIEVCSNAAASPTITVLHAGL
jgi:hypothetical protein